MLIPFPVYKLMFPRTACSTWGCARAGSSTTLGSTGCASLVVAPRDVARRRGSRISAPTIRSTRERRAATSTSWSGKAIYFAQFFALELFFRGLWLGALRPSLGSGAIFSMCVPYCMIHFGKPYLEVNGAIVAGIVLGSLSMRTKSIYAGFLVHVTVALSMDLLALSHRHALPHTFWAPL